MLHSDFERTKNIGIIRPAMIFTSRYQNPAIDEELHVPVGVTLYPPRFKLHYRLAANLTAIAPSKETFAIYNKEKYRKEYLANIERIGVEPIHNMLGTLEQPGKSLVLLCFEDVRIDGLWCHRRMFAEWWTRMTGHVIEELPDPTEPTVKNKGLPTTKKTSATPLFDAVE